MKKKIRKVALIACIVLVVGLTGLFLSHDSVIEVTVPQVSAAQIAAQKEVEAKQNQAIQRQKLLSRIVSCRADEDCIIVDKDPCGCAAGPRGVTAVNVNYITQFTQINKQPSTKTCSETLSSVKECSPNARAVCKAHICKIKY